MNEATVDTISLRGAGIVTIAQPAKGQRFTLDSLLLADFCRIRPRERVLEPGAGTGIITLLLAKKFPTTRITAVEMHEASADICRWNAHANSIEDRVSVIRADIAKIGKSFPAASFDAVVANPPYVNMGAGKRSPSPARRMARQDSVADISAWINLRVLLKNRGRFFIIFTASRASELLAALRGRDVEPKRMRFVHPSAGKPASLVLVEAVKTARTGVEVMPPLIVHDANGAYSSEVLDIYGM